jgi:DNA-binding MarR family transcriptional regulator
MRGPDPAAGLVSLIAKTSARMNRALAAKLKAAGISVTPEQWAVFAAVVGCPGSAQARIAEKGLKDRATVTRMIDVLERDGLLGRRSDGRDRRTYRIVLSKAGERTVERILPLIADVNKEMTEGLSKSEIRTLGRLLLIVESNLSEVVGPATATLARRAGSSPTGSPRRMRAGTRGGTRVSPRARALPRRVS